MNAAGAVFGERLDAEFAAAASRLSSGVVSTEHRRAALQRFRDTGLPHLRDDQWRYASLRAVERASFVPPPPTGGAPVSVALPAALPGITRLVFVNGHHVAGLSSPDAGELLSVGAARDPFAPFSADERFGWLNEAFAPDAVRLNLAGRRSVEVLFVTAASDAGEAACAAYPRLQLDVAADAHVCLVERHLGGAGPQGLIDAAVQLRLHAGAQCAHYRLQDCARDALFLDSLVAQVGRDARYSLLQMGLGAGAARSSLRVMLADARAAAVVRTVALADAQRVLDHAVTVEHAAADTRSEQVFRAIANTRARIAMLSRVRVTAAAGGSDSRQSLKGLIAAGQAEIDLRPELEIHTDAVQASHGATTGALDQTALFYLLSRGLDRDNARLLLEWAFLEDVLAHIGVPQLRAEVERASAEGLGRAELLGELL